jgi:hypothetical protein
VRHRRNRKRRRFGHGHGEGPSGCESGQLEDETQRPRAICLGKGPNLGQSPIRPQQTCRWNEQALARSQARRVQPGQAQSRVPTISCSSTVDSAEGLPGFVDFLQQVAVPDQTEIQALVADTVKGEKNPWSGIADDLALPEHSMADAASTRKGVR